MKLKSDIAKKITMDIGRTILQKAHDDKEYNILDSHLELMDYLQKLEFFVTLDRELSIMELE